MDLGEIEQCGVDSIGLAQDRGKGRALVNAVMTFEFHKMLGNCRVATQLVASWVVLCSLELVIQSMVNLTTFSVSRSMFPNSTIVRNEMQRTWSTAVLFSFMVPYRHLLDRLCGLVFRVPGYRSRGPGSIPGATTFSEK
jgi:hypothetical protein